MIFIEKLAQSINHPGLQDDGPRQQDDHPETSCLTNMTALIREPKNQRKEKCIKEFVQNRSPILRPTATAQCGATKPYGCQCLLHFLVIFLRCPTFPHPCAVLLCSNTTMSPAGLSANNVIAQRTQPKTQIQAH